MQKVLLAVDGSDSCNKAIKKVADMAEEMEIELTVLTVIEEKLFETGGSEGQIIAEQMAMKDEVEDKAEDIMGACVGAFDHVEEIDKKVEYGDPAKKICEEASNQNYDIVALADMGKSSVKKFLLGSTAEKVVRYCNTTVMVVK